MPCCSRMLWKYSREYCSKNNPALLVPNSFVFDWCWRQGTGWKSLCQTQFGFFSLYYSRTVSRKCWWLSKSLFHYIHEQDYLFKPNLLCMFTHVYLKIATASWFLWDVLCFYIFICPFGPIWGDPCHFSELSYNTRNNNWNNANE